MKHFGQMNKCTESMYYTPRECRGDTFYIHVTLCCNKKKPESVFYICHKDNIFQIALRPFDFFKEINFAPWYQNTALV